MFATADSFIAFAIFGPTSRRTTLWLKKTGPLLYFQMTSTNTDQYPQFLVHRISNQPPILTCLIASFDETGYRLRLILQQTVSRVQS